MKIVNIVLFTIIIAVVVAGIVGFVIALLKDD